MLSHKNVNQETEGGIQSTEMEAANSQGRVEMKPPYNLVQAGTFVSRDCEFQRSWSARRRAEQSHSHHGDNELREKREDGH